MKTTIYFFVLCFLFLFANSCTKDVGKLAPNNSSHEYRDDVVGNYSGSMHETGSNQNGSWNIFVPQTISIGKDSLLVDHILINNVSYLMHADYTVDYFLDPWSSASFSFTTDSVYYYQHDEHHGMGGEYYDTYGGSKHK